MSARDLPVGQCSTVELFDTDVLVDEHGVVRWRESGKIPNSDVLGEWHLAGKRFNFALTAARRKYEFALTQVPRTQLHRIPEEIGYFSIDDGW